MTRRFLTAAVLLLAASAAWANAARVELAREILRRIPDWPGAQVEIPIEVYADFVRESVTGPVPPQPPEVVWIERAVWRVKIGDPEVSVEPAFEIISLPGEGSRSVRLLPGVWAWRDATLDGNPVELRRDAKDGWFYIDIPKPGRCRVAAKAVVKPNPPVGDVWRIAIAGPKAAWNSGSVDATGAWEVRFTGAPLPIIGDEKGTRGTVGLLPRDAMEVSWHPPGRAVHREARIEADSQIGWTLGDGVHQVRAVVDLRLWGGEVEELRIDLPAGADRASILGPDVREVQMQGGAARIFLRGKISQRTRLNISYEVPRPKTGKMSFPAFGVQGAAGRGGNLAIGGGAGAVLLELETPGLTGMALHDVPDSVRGLLSSPPVFAYEIGRGQWDARIDLVDMAEFPVRETLVDSALYTVLYRPDGQVMAKVLYEVRNRGQQYMRVDLPAGARLIVARVAEQQRNLARGPGDTVYVPLEKSVLTTAGLISFPVELVYMMRGPALSREGELRLPLPRTDLPVAYARCALMLPGGLQVREWQGTLRQVPTWSSEAANVEFEYGRGHLVVPPKVESPKPKEKPQSREQVRRQQDKADSENKIRQLWEHATELRKSMRFGEAIQVLDRLLVVDPNDERALRWREDLLLLESQGRQVRTEREGEFAALRYPTAKEWKDLTDFRREFSKAASQEPKAVAETRRRLSETIDLDLENVPLNDALKRITDLKPGLNIMVDPDIAAAKIDLSTRMVNLKVTGVSVQAVLGLILGADLGYRVGSGYILVTTKDKLQQNRPVVASPGEDRVARIPDVGHGAPLFEVGDVTAAAHAEAPPKEPAAPQKPEIERALTPQEQILQGRNSYRAGVDFYNRGDYRRAGELFKQTVEVAPASSEAENAKKYLGNITIALGDADGDAAKGDRGLRAATKAIQLSQQAGNVEILHRQQELLQQAEQAARSGEDARAEAAYKVAVDIAQDLQSRGEAAKEQSSVTRKARQFLEESDRKHQAEAQQVAELQKQVQSLKQSITAQGGREAAQVVEALTEGPRQDYIYTGLYFNDSRSPTVQAPSPKSAVAPAKTPPAAQGIIRGPAPEVPPQPDAQRQHMEGVQALPPGQDRWGGQAGFLPAQTQAVPAQKMPDAVAAQQPGRQVQFGRALAEQQVALGSGAVTGGQRKTKKPVAQPFQFEAGAVVAGDQVRQLQQQVEELKAISSELAQSAAGVTKAGAGTLTITTDGRATTPLSTDLSRKVAEKAKALAADAQRASELAKLGRLAEADAILRDVERQQAVTTRAAEALAKAGAYKALSPRPAIEPQGGAAPEESKRGHGITWEVHGAPHDYAEAAVGDLPATVAFEDAAKKVATAREELSRQAKELGRVQFDVSGIAQAEGDERRLADFVTSNYGWAFRGRSGRTAATYSGGTTINAGAVTDFNGEATVQVTDGNLAVINDPAAVSQVQAVIDRLRANLGQRVGVGSRNIFVDARAAQAAGIKWEAGANGVRYAVVNEGQLLGVLDIEQRRPPAPQAATLPREARQDAVVGTSALIANGGVVSIANAADEANGLAYNGNNFEVAHEDYLMIDNGGYLTAVKSSRMRHWAAEAEPVRFPGVPAAVTIPAVGWTVKFEKTLLDASDSLELVTRYTWQGEEK